MNKVFLGVPCYRGELHMDTAIAAMQASADPNLVTTAFRPSSLLARSCNELYVQALNQRESHGFTHFALLHADIGSAIPFWMDVLVQIMEREKADLLSVVSPMKDHRGLTTTCIYKPGEMRRLTMKEVFERKPTWTEENLTVNTGMCLVDLRNPACEHYIFRMYDAIEKEGDVFKARGLSEDWLFSRSVTDNGGKVFATREIPIKHYGAQIFGNQEVWGRWETDQLGR